MSDLSPLQTDTSDQSTGDWQPPPDGAPSPMPTSDNDQHELPEGIDQPTVDALGLLSEALENTERARGRLYDFHQLTGKADMKLDDAVEAFRKAGHDEIADRIEQDLIGRNVLPGMWTFAIVEAYDDGYYAAFTQIERQARDELAQGRRHLYESQLKVARRRGKRFQDP